MLREQGYNSLKNEMKIQRKLFQEERVKKNDLWKLAVDFPGGSVVKTSHSNAASVG